VDGIEHALNILKEKDNNTMLIFSMVAILDSHIQEEDLMSIFSPNYTDQKILEFTV